MQGTPITVISEAMKALAVVITLLLSGCTTWGSNPLSVAEFHPPLYQNAWGYSIKSGPVDGSQMMAYFGPYFGTPSETVCKISRANDAWTGSPLYNFRTQNARAATLSECRKITIVPGGHDYWALSFLNSGAGVGFSSRDMCETVRKGGNWNGYLPSACTLVSVTGL